MPKVIFFRGAAVLVSDNCSYCDDASNKITLEIDCGTFCEFICHQCVKDLKNVMDNIHLDKDGNICQN